MATITTTDDRTAGLGELMARPPSRLPPSVGAAAVGFAVLSALGTFLILTGNTPIAPTHAVVVAVLGLNGLLCLLLAALIVWEIWPLWVAHRKGTAAARLHGRIVGMFCAVATIPAVVVAIVSALTLSGGLDRWFAERTRTVVESAALVGRAYLNEQVSSLRNEIVAMAGDVARLRPLFETERARFDAIVSNQAAVRGFSVAYILRGDRSVVMRAETGVTVDLPLPPAEAMEVGPDEPLLLSPGEGETAGALGAVLRLRGYDAMVLYVARQIDPRVVRYLTDAEAAAAEYEIAQARRTGVQLAFGLMYAAIAFILLLSAIWFGIAFANRMVAPIRRLIGASDQVSRGNLYVQVPVNPNEGDLAQLCRTFNTMTTELRQQRDRLLSASAQIDERRQFTEAVLSGVTAGVVGLNARLVVTLANRSALALLGLDEGEANGRALPDLVPEIAPLLEEARRTDRSVSGEATLTRRGRDRVLSVRVTSDKAGSAEHGFVVTIDDITDLMTAQRSAAWADVARRIAHEIKNPLTPIQLSAERLKRKYAKYIEVDREVFDQCTDTIIRQVGDIGRMVDEFSSFARMPKAQMGEEDLAETVKQAGFLMRVGYPDIEITVEVPDQPVPAVFDRRLISQALTNVIKNATEAVTAVPGVGPGEGRVRVALEVMADLAIVSVVDNGVGLPRENRQKLLEPYMTTREKGTGLGLAIVRKILEEHGGTIDLLDAPAVAEGGRGAMVRLAFPVRRPAPSPDASRN
jgi:two-component system nitrogen regulation sensor histidine kinase NtrY